MTSYDRAREITPCESIETTLCSEPLRVQFREEGVGKRKSGPIASVMISGRLA